MLGKSDGCLWWRLVMPTERGSGEGFDKENVFDYVMQMKERRGGAGYDSSRLLVSGPLPHGRKKRLRSSAVWSMFPSPLPCCCCCSQYSSWTGLGWARPHRCLPSHDVRLVLLTSADARPRPFACFVLPPRAPATRSLPHSPAVTATRSYQLQRLGRKILAGSARPGPAGHARGSIRRHLGSGHRRGLRPRGRGPGGLRASQAPSGRGDLRRRVAAAHTLFPGRTGPASPM